MNEQKLKFTLIDDETEPQSAMVMACDAIAIVLICGWFVLLGESMFPGSWPISVIFFASIPTCVFIIEATKS